MWIEALDPKATHINNPDCPSRLVPVPYVYGSGWMCIDCGCPILHKRVEVIPKPDTGVLGAFAARAQAEEDEKFVDAIHKVIREGEPK